MKGRQGLITKTAHTFEPIPLPPLSEQPLVSILTSNFNYGHFIEEAIQSVLDQTYPHFEMIIADDGSTDDSVERILRFAQSDDRIKVLVGPNRGQADAWNKAYAQSSGEIISVLDSDDAFIKEKLHSVVKRFQSVPGAGILVHSMLIVDASGSPIRQMPPEPNFDEGWIGRQVLNHRGRWRAMPSSALCFRREPAQVIFPIPEDVGRIGADGFVMQIGPLLTPVTSLAQPLTRYRSHEHNATRSYGNFKALENLQKRADNSYRMSLALENRLREANLPDRIPPIQQSPRITYWTSLLDGSSFMTRLSLLQPLVGETLRDELDPVSKRIIKAGVFSLSLILPLGLRANLMDRFFSLTAYYLEPRPAERIRDRISLLVPFKRFSHKGDTA